MSEPSPSAYFWRLAGLFVFCYFPRFFKRALWRNPKSRTWLIKQMDIMAENVPSDDARMVNLFKDKVEHMKNRAVEDF